MNLRFLALPLLAFTLGFSSCEDDDDPVVAPTTFNVTVENVSMNGLIMTDRAGGMNPMSPVVYAVFEGDDPMFEVGEDATEGTERVAEDGASDALIAQVTGNSDVSASGVATAPADGMPPIFSGETATFTFTARPGDKLQFETMFVQSNDWFYAFNNGGLELFNGNTPISGDVTSNVRVYDAGTEADTAPGTGPDQKPVQATDDQGPEEDEEIENARTRHPGFTIPANNQVIRFTVTPAS